MRNGILIDFHQDASKKWLWSIWRTDDKGHPAGVMICQTMLLFDTMSEAKESIKRELSLIRAAWPREIEYTRNHDWKQRWNLLDFSPKGEHRYE